VSRLDTFRLLQLGSQALPIGGFSYSHGLESAIEARRVKDEASAGAFIFDVVRFSIVPFDLPVLAECVEAWAEEDFDRIRRLNDEFLASRESAEFRAAAVQMGHSLRVLCATVTGFPPRWLEALKSIDEPSLACAWAALGAAWSMDPADLVTAYVWSFLENQVLAAVKSVPLGQSSGQRILGELSMKITALLAVPRPPGRPRTNFAPGLAILSARHETQYSRLFRS
jgi:urease accessory protein